jgi:hypothetical protein
MSRKWQLLLIVAFIANICDAINDWKQKQIYGEKSLAEFVAMSRKMGIETECVHPKMIALTFDDGPQYMHERDKNMFHCNF